MKVNQYKKKFQTKFSITTLIRQILMEDEAIKNIVGDKIYPIIAPEKTDGAFLVYVRDSYSFVRSKQGIWQQICKVYISCCSNDYDESVALADAVFQALEHNHYHIDEDKDYMRYINMYDSTENVVDDTYIQTLAFEIY